MGAEGQCVAHVEDKVLFVPEAAPGDRCRIRVGRSKRSYMTGTIEELLEPSPLRVEPRCEVFGACGGCMWQQLAYEEQLRGKAQQAADAMTRIGHIEIEETEPIVRVYTEAPTEEAASALADEYVSLVEQQLARK